MVEVFKTNISQINVAESVLQDLLKHFPSSSINFDLEDCDKILRIENCLAKPESIVLFLNRNGFECEILK
ncbi:hypothetical protein BXY75_1577 [Ulvibacter antarcticus]|uniref:HMA domain-containing protein n=1 Tax=Ulvibacter antarcticus TaxID=442714 RepID=A0A3L9YXZ5_9FLAO|nr:hypothetical protein BXY75_1577 [Ulvibacter antarcticus]